MCGIAACISNNAKIDRAKFDSMVDIITYRGPDDRGTFFDENVALGHRRLSIIDLSTDGHQPFEMIAGYVLIFNGEIFNYVELREELTKKGYNIKTKTDTEIIIHSYIEWGEKCVTHFNGMWAFVLYDKKNRTLFCSRDRFGVKPLYYTNQEGLFLIASEIKQFFEILTNKPRANKDMLMKYIVRGTIDVPPYTLYEDIYQLEPASNLVYDLAKNTFSKKKYYDIGNSTEQKMGYNEACDLFRERFLEAIKIRLRSDVPLGYFLSGGLDSSAITCVADKIIKSEDKGSFKEQHAVSACFDEEQYNEQEYIDEVIKETGVIIHKEYPNPAELWEELDKIIWHMDEPLGSTSAFAQWIVCKAAKDNGLKVMLDGQGADEQLAGYTSFYPVLFSYLLRKGRFRKFIKEVNQYSATRAKTEKHISYKNVILTAIKDYITPEVLGKFIKRQYVQKVAKIPFDAETIKYVINSEYIYPRNDPRCFIKAYMENELVSLLHREDRNSMAFSIESRTPFLDYMLVDSIFQMPYEYKIKNGYSKSVMRDALKGILPDKVRERTSKFGFVTPEEKWINENKEFYRQKLVDALKVFESLFDTQRVLDWYDSSSMAAKRGDFLIWRIIDSARWVEIFDVEL